MRKEFIIATEVRGTETYSTIYAFNIYDESIDCRKLSKKLLPHISTPMLVIKCISITVNVLTGEIFSYMFPTVF